MDTSTDTLLLVGCSVAGSRNPNSSVPVQIPPLSAFFQRSVAGDGKEDHVVGARSIAALG